MTLQAAKRSQFSILWLMLLTVTVAVGAAWGISLVKNMELAEENLYLRAEVAELKSELGQLSVGDGNRIHVLQIPSASNGSWQWRLYLPDRAWPQGRYFLHVATEFPVDTLPNRSLEQMQLPRQPELSFRLQVLPNQKGLRYLYVLLADADGNFHSVDWLRVEEEPWIVGNTPLYQPRGTKASTGQYTAEANGRVELLRRQVIDESLPEGRARGLLLWLSNSKDG